MLWQIDPAKQTLTQYTMNKLTISQKALRQRQQKAKEANPSPKPQKRDNTFSKSRDLREDRDTRQTKTDESQTFPHSR
jgi:hypothetical protein